MLEQEIIQFMTEHKLTLSAAESCTGGMFSARVINTPGASAVYEAGFVTYANKAKHKLIGVKKKTLKEHSAVSKETAKEMVKGTLKETGADYAVSITGIAGPGGGTDSKPVGLVWIAVSSEKTTETFCHVFKNDRKRNIERFAATALNHLRKMLTKELNN